MRLALISTYPPQSCGIATYTSYLAHEMVGLGCEVTIVAEGSGQQLAPGGIAVRRVFDRDENYVDEIIAAVTRAGANVVHIQHEYGIFGFDDRFLDLLAALRRQGKVTIVTLHTVHSALSIDLGCAHRTQRHPPLGYDVEDYQRRIVKAADRVVVHHDRAIRQMLVRQGAAPERTIVIPHGTLTSAAAPSANVRRTYGVAPNAPLIVALGYFEPAKNSLLTLEALTELHERYPSARAIVGGHIRHPVAETLAYRARCQAYIDDHHMSHYLTVVDHELTEQAMTDLFAAADVACFVYREDTRSVSGALHRAIGAGAAVVAARIAKFDEVGDIADELLVSPTESVELVRLVVRLIEDHDFRQAMTRRLAALAERTTWPVVAAKHLELYQRFARDSDGAMERYAVRA